jgi:AraC-like DNA-binding protein
MHCINLSLTFGNSCTRSAFLSAAVLSKTSDITACVLVMHPIAEAAAQSQTFTSQVKAFAGMQIKLITDNYKQLTFSNEPPYELNEYIIPGASYLTTSGSFGHVLYQQIHNNGVFIRLHHYLLARNCAFIMEEPEQVVKLRFHLNNHIQYHLEGLGNFSFYEQAYNLLYIPFRYNRLHFATSGLYIVADINYPVQTMWKKLPPLVLMNDFQKKIRQQLPAMLTPVNQIASRLLLRDVYQLLETNTYATLQNKSFALLKLVLENISENPVWEPVTLTMHEARAVYHARRLIQENLLHSWTMQELTKRTGLNDYRLKNGFQQLYQTTPADYLREVRMEKAWELLAGKRYSVSEVAGMVGYTNLSAFSKAFKKYFGITARERSKEQ